MTRAIYLRKRASRVLKSVQLDTDLHVVRVMRSIKHRAGLRIGMWGTFLIVLAIAPLCENMIPVDLRIESRNALIWVCCMLLFASGESDAGDYRYLDKAYLPEATAEARRIMSQ